MMRGKMYLMNDKAKAPEFKASGLLHVTTLWKCLLGFMDEASVGAPHSKPQDPEKYFVLFTLA